MALILTVVFLSGILLLVFGVFFMKVKGDDVAYAPETLKMIKRYVEDADTALENINSVSSLIIEEIDIKYKELLLLYQMMEDKKKEILEFGMPPVHDDISYAEYNEYVPEAPDYYEGGPVYDSYDHSEEIGMKMDEIRKYSGVNSKKMILDLYEKGYAEADIARELSMGIGEVQLIIGLSKVGTGNE